MSYERIEKSIEEMMKKSKDVTYRTDEKRFTRERKLTSTDIVWYLTMQKGKSTSVELEEYLKNKNGNYQMEVTKQAFSEQRQYLKPELFIDLNRDYLRSFYQEKKEVKTYKGYRVFAVDGSMFELPNTKKLREEYKAQVNSSKHRISARARVSVLYDVENHFVTDALIKDCEVSEIKMAYENIENVEKAVGLERSIILFDRGYPSIELLIWLEMRNIKYICRLQSTTYKKEREAMLSDDEWIELKLHSDRLRKASREDVIKRAKEMKTLKVRMSQVLLPTGEIEYLISNMEKEIISEKEMKEAYYKRWQVEIGYDILKNKLQVENFTGRTQITIEQDFHAQIYVFNLLQDIKADANRKVKEDSKRKELKYEYQTNLNTLAGYLKNILVGIMFIEDEEEKRELYDIIIRKAKKDLVPIKPNRSFERKEYTGKNKFRTNLRRNT